MMGTLKMFYLWSTAPDRTCQVSMNIFLRVHTYQNNTYQLLKEIFEAMP